MKKIVPAKKTKQQEIKLPVVQEPVADYKPHTPAIATLLFTSKHFDEIASKIGFTQKEWAQMLHLSDRTLQRYAKESRPFEGIYVDRILHIDELLQEGLKIFQSSEMLLKWLKTSKQIMGQELGFEALSYRQGIDALIHQIGRLRYGIVA